MAIPTLFLMLLLQLPSIFATVSSLQSTDCGPYWVAYSFSLGKELYYINDNIVDKVTFCKALQLYIGNGCDLKDHFESSNCALDVLTVHSPSKAGRKLLQKDLNNISSFQSHQNVSKNLSSPQVGIVASGAFLVCCVAICPCIFGKRRKAATHADLTKDTHSIDSASPFEVNAVSEKMPASPLRVPPSPSRFSLSPKLSRIGSLHLHLNQIVKATHNFSDTLRIGEGGFGTVYRAQLEDGLVVAVKRAKREHFETLRTEFSSEVEILAKIDHRNLVKLLGYIDKGNERLLITEYVANGSLREHLDGLRGNILDFNQRLEIAIDVAHGLTYLHTYAEKQIIHRDVKSSNILLTESMRAKVADFGFARVGPSNSDQTHISTKVKGTVGYLDPEYMKTYQLTTKSDVYSFGILLLEILTGRRPVELKKPVEERVTLRWAFRKFDEGNVVALLDPSMKESVNTEVVMKMIELAFQCAAPVRADRPNMKSVVQQLWTIRAEYLKSARRA
ncbi:calmodulin-binding receptor-like cytoplasmic kinase 3 [Prosopis cineraria]|uniref:calmodulin-binding receptor-like cytoplasmic kinase 3 n=1 Tax=Prosopis cineraria TaxID=364024 RepID=UPI00240EB7F2|nr:calmodulin-binding receptor-like cytoplasmic kinase 3 [Prosopis cineraria]